MINNTDLARAAWQKSSFSEQQGGCVSVATLGTHCAVRDSKNTEVHFLVSRDSWTAFISSIRKGEFAIQNTGPAANG